VSREQRSEREVLEHEARRGGPHGPSSKTNIVSSPFSSPRICFTTLLHDMEEGTVRMPVCMQVAVRQRNDRTDAEGTRRQIDGRRQPET
jgi:hypothetical protein